MHLSPGANAPIHRMLPIADLRPYEGNARRHTKRKIERLTEALRRYGQIAPVIIASDGVIIDGHAVVSALRVLGYDEIAVVVVPRLGEDEIKALRLALNRLPQGTRWHPDLLRVELQSLLDVSFDIASIGFPALDLKIRFQNEKYEAAQRADDATGSRGSSQFGDVWLVGDHRLFVRKPNADAPFTTYSERTVFSGLTLMRTPISNPNHPSPESNARLVPENRPDCSAYECLKDLGAIDHPVAVVTEHASLRNLLVAAGDRGLTLSDLRYYDNSALSNSPSRSRPYLLAILHTPQLSRETRFARRSTRCLTSHRLVQELVRRSEVIFDPFFHFGHLLLVAEKVGRKYVGYTTEPWRADSAIRNWERHTGRAATLEETGETHSEAGKLRNSPEVET